MKVIANTLTATATTSMVTGEKGEGNRGVVSLSCVYLAAPLPCPLINRVEIWPLKCECHPPQQWRQQLIHLKTENLPWQPEAWELCHNFQNGWRCLCLCWSRFYADLEELFTVSAGGCPDSSQGSQVCWLEPAGVRRGLPGFPLRQYHCPSQAFSPHRASVSLSLWNERGCTSNSEMSMILPQHLDIC